MDKKISKTEVKGLISELRNAAGIIKNQIHAIDQRIEALFIEKEQLEEVPLTKEDFMFYVRQEIKRRAENYKRRLKYHSHKTGFPFNFSYPILENNPHLALPFLGTENIHVRNSFEESAIYWMFGDLIEQRFAEAIDQFNWPEASVSIDERRQRIAEIDAELAQLEEERDNLASDLMDTGMTQ